MNLQGGTKNGLSAAVSRMITDVSQGNVATL